MKPLFLLLVSEIKSIFLPISGALLALIILFASIYVYQANISTIEGGETTGDIVNEIPFYQETAYKQSVPEREGTVYDTPILLIYIVVHSNEKVVSVKVNKILISNNGIELDVTDKSLFSEGFLKPNQRTLLSALPVYPGLVDYVKIEITYSIDNVQVNRGVTAKYTVPTEVEYGRIYEITVSVDI